MTILTLGELEGEDLKVKNTMINAWADFISFGEFSDSDAWEPINPANELQHNYWNISGPKPEIKHSFVIRLSGSLYWFHSRCNSIIII